MPKLTIVQAADVTVEFTKEHVYVCGVIDAQEVKFRLDPLSAVMIGSATLEAGKALALVLAADLKGE